MPEKKISPPRLLSPIPPAENLSIVVTTLKKGDFPPVPRSSVPNFNSPERYRMFSLGRYTAELALELQNCLNPLVGRDQQGIPLFPGGFVGSISHTTTRREAVATALIGRAADYRGIGVDIEETSRDVSPIAKKILTDDEQLLPLAHLKLICAKEAAFKSMISAKVHIKVITQIALVMVGDQLIAQYGEILAKISFQELDGFTIATAIINRA